MENLSRHEALKGELQRETDKRAEGDRQYGGRKAFASSLILMVEYYRCYLQGRP